MNPHYKGRPFATHAVNTLPYQIRETVKSHKAIGSLTLHMQQTVRQRMSLMEQQKFIPVEMAIPLSKVVFI